MAVTKLFFFCLNTKQTKKRVISPYSALKYRFDYNAVQWGTDL